VAGTFVLFVALVVRLTAGVWLRVKSHREGVFAVAGFGAGFLAEAKHPVGQARGELSPI